MKTILIKCNEVHKSADMCKQGGIVLVFSGLRSKSYDICCAELGWLTILDRHRLLSCSQVYKMIGQISRVVCIQENKTLKWGPTRAVYALAFACLVHQYIDHLRRLRIRVALAEASTT